VLDIGAGYGVLTAAAAGRGARVISIERDARLARVLRRRFATADVAVVEADALELALPRRPYRVVANIPFAITTTLLGRLLDDPQSRLEPSALVLQWETARQLTSPRPANSRHLWWQSRFELAVRRRLPPSSFRPAPSVGAAVVSIRRRERPLVAPGDRRAFLRLLTVAHRRGSVQTVLAPILTRRQLQRALREAGARSGDPVASLTVEQWATIAATTSAVVHPSRWPRKPPRWWR
jgi:23S rRNA (adenine-N6)-dimethyltransferase